MIFRSTNQRSQQTVERMASDGLHPFEKRMWEVSYGTTAEFDFCPVCGSFDDHRLEDGTYECGEFQTVSEEELIEKSINSLRRMTNLLNIKKEKNKE